MVSAEEIGQATEEERRTLNHIGISSSHLPVSEHGR